MIPKSGKSPADSRKSVGIQEFAALARSSLNGISQAVRDHVTKPTSLAQGRVAHLIEWKGWPKPTAPPSSAHAHFSSYCHLTEGEKEARFAAGVAEQFAIAEAKLRAWASVDDDEEEDSNDEEPLHGEKPPSFAQSSDATTCSRVAGAPCQSEQSGDAVAASERPLGSGRSGLPSARPGSHSGSSVLTNNCTNPYRGEEEEEDEEEEEEEEEEAHRNEQPAPLQEQRSEVCVHHKPEWRSRARSSRFDSCYSTSESPGEEEEEEDEEEEEGSVFQDVRVWHCSQRSFFSDRASSGVASFDEEEERDEAEDGEKEFLM